MVHPPCSGESGFPYLGCWAWVGEGARGSLVGQGCVGSKRLPARTGLSAGSWHFVTLAVWLEIPLRYQPNTVPSRALIQAYSLTVKTRKKWCSRVVNSLQPRPAKVDSFKNGGKSDTQTCSACVLWLFGGVSRWAEHCVGFGGYELVFFIFFFNFYFYFMADNLEKLSRIQVLNCSLYLLGSQLPVCWHLHELLTISGSDPWVSECVRVCLGWAR